MRSPLPPELGRFLAEPRPAVVAVVGAHGEPVSAATWYLYDDGRVVLSMEHGGARHRHLRADPRLSLTVLGDDWYTHVSVIARVTELCDDADLSDIDRISQHYRGEPYRRRDERLVTAVAEVSRWHTYGSP